MDFDFSGVNLFLSYLDRRATLRQVLAHPAYQAVGQHFRLFAGGMVDTGPLDRPPAPRSLLVKDIENALHGRPSPFYGLEDLQARLPRIRVFLDLLRARENEWCAAAETTLARLFPKEDLDIRIYPIIGYDMGIGLNGAACLNCNYESYLVEPQEFLFYAIHECAHVIYERHHALPPLAEVVTPADWRSYFNLWTQDEGFAVYAPLKLREARGALAERDYRVLSDPVELERSRRAFLQAWMRLSSQEPLRRQDYLELCFGPQRLTYRIGCELIRRIEKEEGLAAVRKAFLLDGDAFMEKYRHLLEA